MKNTVKTYLYWAVTGTMATIIEFYCLMIGILASIWFPFFMWCGFELIIAAWFSREYYKDFRYICPVCGEVFQPKSFKEFLFSKHRFMERNLTCPKCNLKGMCDEIHRDDI